jgi:hypothetical protein
MAQARAQRARISLACATDPTHGAGAEQLGVTRPTVGRGWRRWAQQRTDGLLDEPRPGAPRRITDAHVERVRTLPWESTPRHATHGSTRAMAQACGLSPTAVRRLWRAVARPSHRSATVTLSQDPLVIATVGISWASTSTPRARPWSCARTQRVSFSSSVGGVPGEQRVRQGEARRRDDHDEHHRATIRPGVPAGAMAARIGRDGGRVALELRTGQIVAEKIVGRPDEIRPAVREAGEKLGRGREWRVEVLASGSFATPPRSVPSRSPRALW